MNNADLFTGCPVQHALQYMGGKWQMGIMNALRKGPARFVEIRQKLPGISEKVLTQELRFFESAGMMDRAVIAGVPSKVIYSLTDQGQELMAVIEKVIGWGYHHLQEQKINKNMLATPMSVIEEIKL